MAHLEISVGSNGVVSAEKALKQMNAAAKETAKQQQQLAGIISEIAAVETKAAEKIANASRKKEEALKASEKHHKSLAAIVAEVSAADEKAAEKSAAAAAKRAAADEKAAARKAAALARENEAWNDALQKALARDERRAASAKRAAQKEEEHWNNAIQRAKAGLDGVLPIRPSLQRIEARINVPAASSSGAAGALEGGALGSLGNSLTSVLPQIAVATVSVAGLHKVIAETSAYDALIARLAGVTDGTAAASEQFEALEKLSDSTIFTENQVVDAFIRLEQNGLKPTAKTLSSFANIASATGTSIEQLAEVSLAASLGNYKGLRQFGIKAVAEGDNLKVTFKGVSETIGNSARDITEYLVSIGETNFAGAAARQLDTMGGAVKKLEDAWGDMFREVGRGRIGDVIKEGMEIATGAVNLMTSAIDILFGKMAQTPPKIQINAGIVAENQEDIIAKAMDARAQKAAKIAADNKGTKIEQETAAYAAETAEQARAARKTATLARQVQEWRDGEEEKHKATNSFFNDLDSRALNSKQKAKEQLDDDLARIKAAREAGQEFDVDAATSAANQAYKNALGTKEYAPKIATVEDTSYTRYQTMRTKQDADELQAVRESLTTKEESALAFYERNKEILEKSKGDQTAYLAANEVAWEKHLAELATKQRDADAKLAREQIELQKRLQSIGVGPQSQIQAVQSKYAGQYFDLGAALSDNLSGKNGPDLKLAAEQTYKEKSVAIEQQRAEEIKKIHVELAAQSVQNTALLFGGLAAVMKNAHGEQSKEYQAMFAIQKGFGIASAEIAMYQSMAEASKLPFPANIPVYIKAAAQGAQIIAQMSSLSYAGGYDSGGDIPRGSYGDVGEMGNLELVSRPSHVRGPAHVIGSRDTAALLSGSSAPVVNLRNVNLFDGDRAVNNFLGSTRGERVLLNVIRRNGNAVQSMMRG
jgi:hypothetical protein